MISCNGVMKGGKRAGSRHRWDNYGVCNWCGRDKKYCAQADRPKLTTEQKQRTRAERSILRKHGFL